MDDVDVGEDVVVVVVAAAAGVGADEPVAPTLPLDLPLSAVLQKANWDVASMMSAADEE